MRKTKSKKKVNKTVLSHRLHRKEALYIFSAFVLVLNIAYITAALTSARAASNSWDFSTAGDYTYDSDKIEFSGGVAQLTLQDWYDAGYTNRKAITIDRTKVSSTFETNFQLLVNTTDTDLKDTGNGGDVGQADGGDIVFGDGGGEGSRVRSFPLQRPFLPV